MLNTKSVLLGKQGLKDDEVHQYDSSYREEDLHHQVITAIEFLSKNERDLLFSLKHAQKYVLDKEKDFQVIERYGLARIAKKLKQINQEAVALISLGLMLHTSPTTTAR
jgi:hypothetical protein